MTIEEVDMKTFSATPYGRYSTDGPSNGETFRVDRLKPLLINPEVDEVRVYLDSVRPGYEYGSSFLEESFGGLIRVENIPYEVIMKKLKIITTHEDYKLEIDGYIERAAKRFSK